MWYQLPGQCLTLAFIVTALWSVREPMSWWQLMGIPIAANLAAGLINWFAYSRALNLGLFLTVFHSGVMWVLTLAAVAVLIYNGSYLLAVVALLGNAFLFTILEFHMFLYSSLSLKYGMHPKYAFFKRHDGRSFPFER